MGRPLSRDFRRLKALLEASRLGKTSRFAMPLSFATWSALLNNFVIEAAEFDGSDIGWLHSVREIPGFLAIGVILVLLVMREQVLALSALALLGAATAVTAWFPSMAGILIITMLSSIGFHYYETVNQSLQLQWLKIEDAPRMIGWLMAAGSLATLVSSYDGALAIRGLGASGVLWLILAGLGLGWVGCVITVNRELAAIEPR